MTRARRIIAPVLVERTGEATKVESKQLGGEKDSASVTIRGASVCAGRASARAAAYTLAEFSQG